MKAKVVAVRMVALITTLCALVAGCGDGTKAATGKTPQPSKPDASSSSKFYMTASASPTTCTTYLYGHHAVVEFASDSFDVAPACQSWIRDSAKQGNRWTELLPNGGLPFDDSPVCLLANANSTVTASVIDDGGQTYGQAACEGLLAVGWVGQHAATTSTPPVTNGPPAAGAPKLVVGHWAGVEPSQIDYSADGGNIVTELIWTRWTNTQALGQGTSDIQSCVPNCAQGAENPVTTTITLLDPENGHFTQMTESRNGITSDYSDNPRSWPQYAS
jgi:hypothetical protein